MESLFPKSRTRIFLFYLVGLDKQEFVCYDLQMIMVNEEPNETEQKLNTWLKRANAPVFPDANNLRSVQFYESKYLTKNDVMLIWESQRRLAANLDLLIAIVSEG